MASKRELSVVAPYTCASSSEYCRCFKGVDALRRKAEQRHQQRTALFDVLVTKENLKRAATSRSKGIYETGTISSFLFLIGARCSARRFSPFDGGLFCLAAHANTWRRKRMHPPMTFSQLSVCLVLLCTFSAKNRSYGPASVMRTLRLSQNSI